MYIPLTFEGALQKCLFASGGYEGYFISGSQQWKYHQFTGSGNLVVQKGTIDNVQIYVIGGGGGGARGTANTTTAAGGGGGGTNFEMNARLFAGTYTAVVGRGAFQQSTQNTNGLNGVGSSFVGSNINMSAAGGGGGTWGDTGVGGTSGNGFAGGSSQTENGGGGGGATAVGNDATSIKAGDGGVGNTFYIAEYEFGYGCGGGGYAINTADTPGYSCNDTQFGAGGEGNNSPGQGANTFGMGGGGGGNFGAAGGSGSVIIQYPIYDYCSNYFNETGSCGCRQLSLDVSDGGGFYPQITGSYLYMPCGENKFFSGSITAYSPLTLCAVSNSYYSISKRDPVNSTLIVQSGFMNDIYQAAAPECVSASLVPTTCSLESFAPTCTSSIVTIYTPSASVGSPNTFAYVAKNETTHSIYTSTSARVRYICISTGSLFENNQIYPQVLTGGNVSLFNTVSCNLVTFTSTAAFPANRFYSYYNCNGVYTNGSFSGPGSATFCVDTTAPFGFVATSQTNTSVTIGGNCLSGSFDTASCGCP